MTGMKIAKILEDAIQGIEKTLNRSGVNEMMRDRVMLLADVKALATQMKKMHCELVESYQGRQETKRPSGVDFEDTVEYLMMEPSFLADTDMRSVESVAAQFAENAMTNHLYSMAEIVAEMYGVGYDTDEFWRVAVHVGPAISAHGFKRVYWRNRRYWVKEQ